MRLATLLLLFSMAGCWGHKEYQMPDDGLKRTDGTLLYGADFQTCNPSSEPIAGRQTRCCAVEFECWSEAAGFDTTGFAFLLFRHPMRMDALASDDESSGIHKTKTVMAMEANIQPYFSATFEVSTGSWP